MNSKSSSKIVLLLAALGLGTFSGTVSAIPVAYSGYDIGTTSLATSPNATAAAAAFDLATGLLSLIDFESALPAGVSAFGGTAGEATSVCFTPDLHCYATSGTDVYRNNGASFNFDNAIDSFGAYFTGWQITGQTITLGYSDGTTSLLDMPAGNRQGGTVFFGFIDHGASITSISYVAGAPGDVDAVGIDDIRYGNAVPAPASSMLFSLGLVGLGFYRRKRNS